MGPLLSAVGRNVSAMQYGSTRKAVLPMEYHVIWCLKPRTRVSSRIPAPEER